jgi:DNA-binding CsgD family transcriptional regulator/tetratricopeptide (TPR) repeat protein
MELLERHEALAALGAACAAAARGEGCVVYVTGEPGIGKTSLVSQFVRECEAGARVLLGTCDDLYIPRPLGPFQDLAGSVSAPLGQALATGAAPHEIQTLLIAELEQAPGPTVLVLEDVHWADTATLDTITVLGRRIGSLPALLVLTFRSGEVSSGHPLHATLGAIQADDSLILELEPLSPAAVAELAGDCATQVYEATGGNPFYVTELLASRTDTELPPPVANAVLGRAARLDPGSRRLLELVSVVPARLSTSLLDRVMPSWPEAAEEPERRQLLEVDPAFVRFRHELARHAIRSSVTAAAQRRLHGEILAALLAAGADPADIVHHAEAAGAEEVVAMYALVAARRAATLNSNREAVMHYRRAAEFVDRHPRPEQAAVLEELALAAYAVNRLDQAFPALERAIEIYEELGDRESVGRCTRVRARFSWYLGDGQAAWRNAREAVATLEPLGESVALARAYSELSQLSMLEEDTGPALEWGARAIELADRLGDESTRVHALVNVGGARIMLDYRDAATLLDAHKAADAIPDRHEAGRALVNLGYSLMSWVQPQPALHYLGLGVAYAREHEIHTLASYGITAEAWLRLRAGDWDEAEAIARMQLERGTSVTQLLAKTVLADLAIRRGDPDASERLADLAAQADRAGELQRIAPVLELTVAHALTGGCAMPADQLEAKASEIRRRGGPTGSEAMRIAAWAAVAGIDAGSAPPLMSPHALMIRREWAEAAEAFGDAGWCYEQALLLTLVDDEESLVEALDIARTLGAEPLARCAAQRLRELGLRVPRGPRPATRANSAGLTARQLQVLTLLGEGLTNAEIAERLVVSPRTAEHHVAAVLAKLGATSRWEASRRAVELDLVERA